jgi:hypothetical protein
LLPGVSVAANSNSGGAGSSTPPPVIAPPPTPSLDTRPGFGFGDNNHIHTKSR